MRREGFCREHPLFGRGHSNLKCYCGFVCQTESELKEHVLKTHGARDGDWKGWISK